MSLKVILSFDRFLLLIFLTSVQRKCHLNTLFIISNISSNSKPEGKIGLDLQQRCPSARPCFRRCRLAWQNCLTITWQTCISHAFLMADILMFFAIKSSSRGHTWGRTGQGKIPRVRTQARMYIETQCLDWLYLNDLTLWRKPYINLLFFWLGITRLGWGVSNAMVAIYQTTGLLRLRINGCSRHKQTNKTGGLINTTSLPSGNWKGGQGKRGEGGAGVL